jgi:hypothetical protein
MRDGAFFMSVFSTGAQDHLPTFMSYDWDMQNENIDDMTRLERICGRIEIFRDSATVGPKGIVLDDMVWMESTLRRLLKAENAQAKFTWCGIINKASNMNNLNQAGEKFFEKGFEWRDEDDKDGRNKLK